MNITPFVFDEHQVRAFTLEMNPWFVAKDVAVALGYKNTNKAVSDHCKHARSLGGNVSLPLDPQTKIIPEGDVYRLTFRSKLPSAERFERKVMDEMLPTLRKTGSYSLAVPQTYPEALRVAAGLAEEKNRLTQQLEAAKPAVDFVAQSVETASTFSFGEVAKMLNLKTPDGRAIGRNLLIEGLHNIRALMKQGKHNVPLQEHINAGRFEVKYTFVEIAGAEISVPSTRVTSRGIHWIRRKFVNGGCEPVLTKVK